MAEKEGQAPPPPRKKKKGGHGGHHGGAWKVAFADFMTSMFALFLVLWVIATTSITQRAAIANYFRNPTLFKPGSNKPMIINPTNEGGAEKTQTEGSSNSETTNQLASDNASASDEEKLEKLQEQLEQDSTLKELGTQFKVEMTDQGLKIELNEAGTTGVFQMGSSDLTPAMAEQIAHISQAISGIDNRVVVAGYTDKYAYSGSKYTNWQLSADRANAVRSRLIGSGVDTSRMAAVVGYGDNELANPQNPYSPENRRVSLLVLKNSKNFTLGAK